MQQVAIYIRVSTDEQAEEGYSLDEQRRVCEAYAVSRGWNVAKIYADEGLSAFKDRIEDRPALTQLLSDVRTKRYHAVVVHKLDRFFRRVKLLIATVEDLELQRCALVSVSEQIDFTTPAGRMMLANLGSFAEYYSRNLSAETAKGLRGKARRGDWVGPVPFGYDRHEKTITPNNDAPIVSRIFSMYASGSHSYVSIADALNTDGYTTRDWQTGVRGRWGRENIRGILHNPAYIGMVRCKELLQPGKHQPLTDQATWDQCQRLISDRTTKSGFVPIRSETELRIGRLLSGIARCATCGAPMWCHQSKIYTYYRCAGRDHRTCKAGFVRADMVESQSLEMLKQLVLPSAWRDAILAEAARMYQSSTVSLTRTIDPNIIHRQLERLALVYASGDISTETYTAERTRLKSRLEGMAESKSVVTQWDATLAASMLNEFASIMEYATFEEQRALLKEAFAALWIAPHTVIAHTPTTQMKPVASAIAVQQASGVGMGCPMGLSAPLPTPLNNYWIAPGILWAA